MPISKEEAYDIVKKDVPFGKIQACVEYNGLYLFQVFDSRPGEEEMDPFYSVNKDTRELKEFSLFTDGDMTQVVSLFKQAKETG